MTRDQIQKSVLLYLYWLGFITATLIVVLTDLLPFRLSFVSPDNLFLCLIQAELFFVLIIWPLFIPSLMKMQVAEPKASLVFLQVAMLFLFGLPLALVCESVSRAGALEFFRANIMVAVLAVFVASLFRMAHHMKFRIEPWYYGGIFVLSAALPFLFFLANEHGSDGPAWMSVVSPFWAAVVPGSAMILTGIFGTAAVVLIAVPFARRIR